MKDQALASELQWLSCQVAEHAGYQRSSLVCHHAHHRCFSVSLAQLVIDVSVGTVSEMPAAAAELSTLTVISEEGDPVPTRERTV